MIKNDEMKNNSKLNNKCTSSVCNSSNPVTSNCSCETCTKEILFNDSSKLKSNIPILSDAIVDCIKIKNTQYMRSSPINFTIDTTNTIYKSNSPICINNITYSYNCLGLPLPETFYFCGNTQNFEIDGPSCNCSTLVNRLPDNILEQIRNTVSSANQSIALGEAVLSSPTVSQKYSTAVDAAQSLGDTIVNASNAVNSILNYEFPSPITNDYLQALLNLSSSSVFLTNAANDTASLLDGLNPTTIQSIANNVINSANQVIAGATLIINNPASSAQSIVSANNAIGSAQNALNLANTVAANPDGQSFSNVNNLIFYGYFAEGYLDQALISSIESSGNSALQPFLDSVGEVVYSTLLIQYALDNIISTNSFPSQEIVLLNSAGNAIIDAGRYSKDAVNFPNIISQLTSPLYRDFSLTFSSNKCNKVNCCSCDCQSNSNTIKQLFFHPIYSFHICDLKICVCGTIGGQKFSAHANFEGITPLEDLGYDTIKLDSLICTPVNSVFTLRESFDLCFGIQCILPTEYLILENPLNFKASLYSFINVNTNISTTVKKPISTLSKDVTWLC